MKVGVCKKCGLVTPGCLTKCRKCDQPLRVTHLRHSAFDNDSHRLLAAVCDDPMVTKTMIQRRLSGQITTLRLDQLIRAFEEKGYITRALERGERAVRFHATPLAVEIFEKLLVRCLGDRLTGIIEETFDEKMIEAAAGIPNLEALAAQITMTRQAEAPAETPRETASVGSILGILPK